MEPWIQTYTGKKFDYRYSTEKMADIIEINDIARSLSMQCRYAGHCYRFYSIAEHSYLVSKMVPDHLALVGLMHDAAEAYLTDLPSPLKEILPEFKKLEKKVHKAVMLAYKIQYSKKDYELIKLADTQILKSEAIKIIATPHVDNWAAELPSGPAIELELWSPSIAEAVFKGRFFEIINSDKKRVA